MVLQVYFMKFYSYVHSEWKCDSHSCESIKPTFADAFAQFEPLRIYETLRDGVGQVHADVRQYVGGDGVAWQGVGGVLHHDAGLVRRGRPARRRADAH